MVAGFRWLWALVAGLTLHAAAQLPAREDTPNAAALPAAVQPSAPQRSAPPAVALVLPGTQTPFAPAAEAVREGFVAARSASPEPIAIQVIEVDATIDAAIRAMEAARERGVRLIVGPLTRDSAKGVAERGDLGVPVLLLAMPEKSVLIPSTQLAFGLSVEDEAAFLVRELLRPSAASEVRESKGQAIVIGEGAFARRTGAALLAALRAAGETPLVLDFGPLDAEGIAREIAKAAPAAILFALDPADAVQVRTRLPVDAPLFATSQINAGASTMVATDLDGVRFVDLPWMIDPLRGPLARFDRAPSSYGADQQRLYALGIDAFRVASAWVREVPVNEFEGATGTLRADRKQAARVERKLAFAVFLDGRVQPLDNLRQTVQNDAACVTGSCSDDLSAPKLREPNPAPAGR